MNRYNTSHLEALRIGLAHEQARLSAAKDLGEIEMRSVWVSQIEKEIVAEIAFLEARGVTVDAVPELDEILSEMSDEEILRELLG